MSNSFTLLEANDSVLIVIDVQDFFLHKLDKSVARRVVQRIRWLIQLAGWLRIPVMVTAEDLAVNGPTTAALREVLPPGAVDLNKVVFGLAAQADICERVVATTRKTAVLVGLETDVCIQHSALGLASRGFRVVVVVDATASPDTGHEIGLARMREAGITLVSAKSLFFEWVRDVETSHRFFRTSGIETPPDLYIG